jgi:hypothetical protein
MEGASFSDPAFDPEQAGIVCDRLAGELLRAAHANPDALRSLRLDARDLLACTSAWLDRRQACRVPTFPEEVYDTPQTLASGLRELAEYLLELAEAAGREPPDGD